MSKLVKEIILIIILVLLAIGIHCFYNYTDFSFLTDILSNKAIAVIILSMLLFTIFSIIFFIRGRVKSKKLKSRDRLFNSLVKNADTIYFMVDDKKEEIVYSTDNVEEVLGLKDIENNNEAISEFLKTPFIASAIENWDKKSDFVSPMFSYRSPSYQHTRWYKVKIYPNNSKKLHYSIYLISDVTSEHDQQHLLVLQASDIRTREHQLNSITSSSYDVEININLVSDEYISKNLKEDVSYFGPSRSGIYSKELNDILNNYIENEDIKEVLNILSLDNLKKYKSLENPENLSVRYRLANKKDVTWLESTIFFTTDKGEDIATILTKNVTENAEYMRRQNAILQSALKEAKLANTSKSEFLKTMSHEIRIPMSTIIGLSESLLDENLTKEVKEDIENINSASNNILEIINGILDIGKVESRTIELDEKEYDTSKFFNDIKCVAKEQIGKKDIKLNTNIDDNLPITLFGDSGKIKQILNNIINNAAKYTDNGSITIDVRGEKKDSSIKLIISVSDTGKGIKKEELDNLFNTSKKIEFESIKGKESGIGLLITQNLIDILNGQIEVESTPNVGSTFTVSINQKITDDKAIGDIINYKASKKRLDTFDINGAKILIVDDNKLNIKVATRLLKSYNTLITEANSGLECIELVKNNSYDIILLDQMMPNMDGIETFSKLKEINGFNIPTIMLTADAIKGKKEEYLNIGFNDYLSKPIDVNELNRILVKYLSK